MAEPFETLREVGVALQGFREDVAGQFSTLKWILGGLAAAGFAVSAILFGKIDTLEETVARNSAILERIEAKLDRVALDTGSIKESVQTASAKPDVGSFDGYVGVKTGVTMPEAVLKKAIGGSPDTDVWIYYPEE